MDAAAPPALQRLVAGREVLEIPAESVDQFALEFYPRLRSVVEVTSSDDSFTPPEITGPDAVLSADYHPGHRVVLSWSWSYRLGDREFRIPVDSGENNGVRDLDAEGELGCDIDAPLELFGLRDDEGLLTDAVLDGADTMRFATELQPLLADTDGVTVEILGQPVDYREAGESLRIGVSTAARAGRTTGSTCASRSASRARRSRCPNCSPRSLPVRTIYCSATVPTFRSTSPNW